MITRRGAILLSIGGAMEFGAFGFAPGEFWNDKQPSEWSSKDVERLLTKSPWSKEVSAELNSNFSASPDSSGRGGSMPAGGGGRGGPPMGGGAPPGGGMDGGPGGPGGPEGAPRIKALVRWESAGPIRDASKHELPPMALEMYVISLSGSLGVGGLARGRGPTGQEGAGDPAQEMRAGMKQNTFLQRRGKAAVAAVQVAVSADGITILFFFPKAAVAISLDDKEVDFRTQAGPLEFKTKFLLKEMLYRGKLQL